MSARKAWKDVTMEDLQANPNLYGAPTFEQFCKNRSAYMGRHDDAMTSFSDGPQKFRKDLNNIVYKINGVELSGEDAVEKAIGDHGYSLSDIKVGSKDSPLRHTINYIPLGAGKHDVVIDFLP